MLCFVVSFAKAEKHRWGYDLYWELNNGVLTISGNGAMPNYSKPWKDKGNVENVVIESGVTSIGNGLFKEFDGPHYLKSVVIGNSVTSIGKYAFDGCSSLTSVTIPNSVTSIEEGAFFVCI